MVIKARKWRSWLLPAMVLGLSQPLSTVADTEGDNMRTKQREEQILGRPPHIEPLDETRLPPEAKKTVADIRQAVGAAPLEALPEYFATMAKHPELMRAQIDLSMVFFHGNLPIRDRQLAILRILWLSQAPYAWSQHVDISKREAGLSSAEIDNITRGSTAPGWNDDDRAILKAVEELHDHAMISTDTWKLLESRLTEQQLLELPLLIGSYQATAYLQNSVGFRLMDGFEGLDAR